MYIYISIYIYVFTDLKNSILGGWYFKPGASNQRTDGLKIQKIQTPEQSQALSSSSCDKSWRDRPCRQNHVVWRCEKPRQSNVTEGSKILQWLPCFSQTHEIQFRINEEILDKTPLGYEGANVQEAEFDSHAGKVVSHVVSRAS